jgi:hypothetical protein
MRRWKTTLPVAALAVAAIILFAQPDKASAAPVQQPARPAVLTLAAGPAVNPNTDGSLAITMNAPVATGAQDVEPMTTYYMDRQTTQRFWVAWTVGGAVALGSLCPLLGHPALIASCAIVVAVMATFFAGATQPNGRCLAFTTKLGWPPFSVRYITCP